MIDKKSTKILFHTVNKKDGMLIQVSLKFITDILDCIDDRMEKLSLDNQLKDDQYVRIKGYRDQFMSHITELGS